MTRWDSATWRGKKVTVMGLGTFGGQMAAARFFAGLGAKVTVTDKKPRESLEAGLSELADLDIRYALGGHDDKDFADADLVVASPAIPKNSRYLQLAGNSGVAITHEMDIFFQLCRAPIVAVTGSNGKSTTAALLAHILDRCRGNAQKVWLGGNIGKSLLVDVAGIPPTDQVVLELSSFQLEDLGALGLSPRGAVVTNLTPNHLDRHVTFEAYADAKRNITRFQSAGDFLVLNGDDPALAGWDRTAAKVSYFGKSGPKKREGVYLSERTLVSIAEGYAVEADVPKGWRLRGEHNLANLAAACAAAAQMGVPLAEALAGAEDFRSLPHRLEYCATAKGVEFYNDSIATTPESAEVALDSFKQPIVLIAGGYDKRVDLSGFARKAAGRVKALVAIGRTGPVIAAEARARNGDLRIMTATTFDEAIMAAFDAAAPGDIVLMSPACASYDMFNNFEERGDIFRAKAVELAKTTRAAGTY